MLISFKLFDAAVGTEIRLQSTVYVKKKLMLLGFLFSIINTRGSTRFQTATYDCDNKTKRVNGESTWTSRLCLCQFVFARIIILIQYFIARFWELEWTNSLLQCNMQKSAFKFWNNLENKVFLRDDKIMFLQIVYNFDNTLFSFALERRYIKLLSFNSADQVVFKLLNW